MPPDDAIERILVVTAHPDDVDFGSAGSVARWTDAGIDVTYCLCTNGEAVGFDASVPRSTMAEIRQAEQRAAAKVVGVTDVTFLAQPDGRLEGTIAPRRARRVASRHRRRGLPPRRYGVTDRAVCVEAAARLRQTSTLRMTSPSCMARMASLTSWRCMVRETIDPTSSLPCSMRLMRRGK